MSLRGTQRGAVHRRNNSFSISSSLSIMLEAVHMNLLGKLIRLAYEEPHLRPILIPYILYGLQSESCDTFGDRFARKKQNKRDRKRTLQEKKKQLEREKELKGGNVDKLQKEVDELERKEALRKAKNNFLFHAYLVESDSLGPWVDPDTEESNTASTLISKAKKKNKWAEQTLLDLYLDYYSRNKDRADAFEELDSSVVSYEDFKKNINRLMSSPDKVEALDFCKRLDGSFNAYSFTTRRNFYSNFLDSFLWQRTQQKSELVQGGAYAIGYLLSQASAQKASEVLSFFRLEDISELNKEMQGKDEGEIESLLKERFGKKALQHSAKAVRSFVIDEIAGSIGSLGLEGLKEMGLSLEDIPGFSGGELDESSVLGFNVKSYLENACVETIDKISTKLSERADTPESLVEALKFLANTRNNPSELNEEYSSKMEGVKKQLESASSEEELSEAISKMGGVFEAYLNEGVGEARSLSESYALHDLRDPLTKGTRFLSNVLEPLSYVSDGVSAVKNLFGDTPPRTAKAEISRDLMVMRMYSVLDAYRGAQTRQFLKKNISDYSDEIYDSLMRAKNNDEIIDKSYMEMALEYQKMKKFAPEE